MKTHANRQSKQDEGGLQGMEAFSCLFIFQQAALFARRRSYWGSSGRNLFQSEPKRLGYRRETAASRTASLIPLSEFHAATHNYAQHPRTLNMNAACHVQVPCVLPFK